MIQIVFYTGSEHNLKGCLYNPEQRWCYNDLHCDYNDTSSAPSSTDP